MMKPLFIITALTTALLLPGSYALAQDQDQDQDQDRDQKQDRTMDGDQDRDRLPMHQQNRDRPYMQQQNQDQIYGRQLMTQQERAEYRIRLRDAQDDAERREIRDEHHELMRERAKARGVDMPENPPANRGRRMQPDNMQPGNMRPRDGMGR